MRFFIVAALGVLTMSSSALGQSSQIGLYDGRGVSNWFYSEEGTATADLPTWYATNGDTASDGANCNIGVSALQAARADFDAYFASVNPQNYAEQLGESGTVVRASYLTDVFELGGRPAMRNLFSAISNDQLFDVMTLAIGGDGNLMTITCTVRAGGLLNRLQDFYEFEDGLIITMPAPR